jgi:hypothetical protein
MDFDCDISDTVFTISVDDTDESKLKFTGVNFIFFLFFLSSPEVKGSRELLGKFSSLQVTRFTTSFGFTSNNDEKSLALEIIFLDFFSLISLSSFL